MFRRSTRRHAGRRTALQFGVTALATTSFVVGVGSQAAFAVTCPTLVSGVPTVPPVAGTDWSGCDLTGGQLFSLNFSGANLKGANLTGAVLFEANLANANIASTTVAGTLFDAANLQGANLASIHGANASFVASNMRGVNMVLASLNTPDFSSATMNDASLVQLSATFAKFGGTSLLGANLTDAFIPAADLRGANLADANLTNANLSSSNLTGANLTGAILTGVNWAGATCPNGSKAIQHIDQKCTSALDKLPPKVSFTAPASLFSLSRDVAFQWTATDPGGTGARYSARWARQLANGGPLSAWTVPPGYANTAFASYVIASADPGYRYCMQVRATDGAGNVSPWSASKCTTVPFDERTYTANSKWTRSTDAAWFEGTKSTTTLVGATLTSTTSRKVREIGVVATKCPTCGSLVVKVAGITVGTISLVNNVVIDRAVAKLPRLGALKTGVVTFTVSTSGKKVAVDAIAISSF